MNKLRNNVVIAFLMSLWCSMLFVVTMMIFACIVLCVAPFSVGKAHAVALIWARFNIWTLSVLCGLKYQVSGLENVPEEHGFIIMANHQSIWETLAFSFILPRHIWAAKRELFFVPLFGWALASVRAISVDRSSGDTALEQVIKQGRERMNEGICLMIFPEGTRVSAGEKRRYKQGGSVVAVETGRDILPVAHNAGYFWPRAKFIKKPGLISVKIGPVITSADKTAEEINLEVQTWIETEQVAINADAKAQLQDR